MTVGLIVSAALVPVAVWLLLAPLSDVLALLAGRIRGKPVVPPSTAQSEPLLFLIPAHNEELLVERCIESLLAMDFEPMQRRIVVVADNCSDTTADRAARLGAEVLQRTSSTERGKGHAIGWALRQLSLSDVAAVVIVDADTIVLPDFASAICGWAPLRDKALQTYDGISNEFETALTRMAGLLTRNRYGVSLPLKARAGLNCPLTGDGVVLGTGTLSRFSWQVATVTEGWELYARLSVAGQCIGYAANAKLFAQETSSISTSRSQRERWVSGRLEVLRAYYRAIFASRLIGPLQKLDLVAELSNLGPVTHCVLGAAGALAALTTGIPGSVAIAAVLAAPIAHQLVLSTLSLRRHPEPLSTLGAFVWLPPYAVWRIGVALRVLVRGKSRHWVRTERH